MNKKSQLPQGVTTTPIEEEKVETADQKNARLVTGATFSACAVITAYGGRSIDPITMMKTLQAQAEAIHGGDLRQIESMLFNQAIALQSMFAQLATMAVSEKTLTGTQILTQLALRAQSGSRASLQTLAEVKNPRQVAFVKQTNLAHTQQVNNGMPLCSHGKKSELTPNELLVEEPHGCTKMDLRAKATPGRADSAVATVDAVDGREKRRRKA